MGTFVKRHTWRTLHITVISVVACRFRHDSSFTAMLSFRIRRYDTTLCNPLQANCCSFSCTLIRQCWGTCCRGTGVGVDPPLRAGVSTNFSGWESRLFLIPLRLEFFRSRPSVRPSCLLLSLSCVFSFAASPVYYPKHRTISRLSLLCLLFLLNWVNTKYVSNVLM